jgi:hypothetical protein
MSSIPQDSEPLNPFLDDTMTFKPEHLAALRRFRSTKPWRGTIEERCEKLRLLNTELSLACGLPEPALKFEGLGERGGDGLYDPFSHQIILFGKVSVVTYLFCLGGARGFEAVKAQKWAINIFRRVFPRSFAGCRLEGNMLVRDDGEEPVAPQPPPGPPSVTYDVRTSSSRDGRRDIVRFTPRINPNHN